MLTWDDTYEITKALRKTHPDVHLEDVTLNMIYQWTVEIPNFSDDHELANETILAAILQEWYEEINPV